MKAIYLRIKMKDPFKTAGQKQGTRESFLRMEDGNHPFIPATHFKGVLRHELERLGKEDFVSDNLGTLSPDTGREGREYRETRVKFMDLIPSGSWKIAVRPHVSIEQSTRKAGEGHLQFEEVVEKNAEFHGIILLKDSNEEIERTIHAGILSVADFGIGGSRSSGLGRFEIVQFNILEGNAVIEKIKETYLEVRE